MNCMPGDLAVVVRDTMDDPCTASMIGTTVTVDSMNWSADTPYWRIRGPLLRCPLCIDGVFFGFLDADLQPLRPESKAVPAEAAEAARA